MFATPRESEPAVSSSTAPQFAQVEICCEGDCIGQITVRLRLGTDIAVLRQRLPFQEPYRAPRRVESRDNVCANGQHRSATSRLADAFAAPSVHMESPILRWLKD